MILNGPYSICFFAVKYVPEWFPGAGFQKFAREAKENIEKSIILPFQHVKESFKVVRELRLSCERYIETNSRRTLLPHLRLRRRALRNFQSSVKTEWMKRRSVMWLGQYISVSVVITWSMENRY
jgi:hypothetical protein